MGQVGIFAEFSCFGEKKSAKPNKPPLFSEKNGPSPSVRMRSKMIRQFTVFLPKMPFA